MQSSTELESSARSMTGVSRWNRQSSLARREALAAYAFISPAAVFYLVFIAAPLMIGIGLSFFEWDLLTPAKYVGFQNYRASLE